MQLSIHVHNLLHLAKPVNVVFLPFTVSIVVIIIQKNCADGIGGYCTGDKKKQWCHSLFVLKEPVGKLSHYFPQYFLFHRKLINSTKTEESLVSQPLWVSSNILKTPCANSALFLSDNCKLWSFRFFLICSKHRTQNMMVNCILWKGLRWKEKMFQP